MRKVKSGRMPLGKALLFSIFAGTAAAPAVAQEARGWSGPYAGIDVGMTKGDDEAREVNGERFYIAKPDGFSGSAHLGWQRQFGSFVAGIELEGGYVDASGTVTRDVTGGTIVSGAELGAFGALSGRFGVVPAPDWLVFGKVGASLGKLEGSTIQTCTTPSLCDGAQSDPVSAATTESTSLGLLLGAGVERRFSDRWSGRISYQFTGYSKELALPEQDGPGWRHEVDTHAVRLGLSLRF
jgi:outer membrane immunogenic protein